MQLITVCQLWYERNSNALRNSQGGSVRIPGQALAQLATHFISGPNEVTQNTASQL